MRVYLIMSEADAHVDPVYAVFTTEEKAEAYVKENSPPEGEEGYEEAEYMLEVWSMEVEE